MKRLLLLILIFSGLTVVKAQERQVSGTVTSLDDKEGLPGVNVVVEGTTKGTTTNMDGTFNITLQPGENVLLFSFVGYKTQNIQVGNQTTINVVLETDAEILEDVVVVGYGVQRKSDITGSTASIKGEELFQQPVLTATQAIQGKVAGVQIISSGQPGSSPQIRVRGVSTALGATTALYVVDGVLTDDISNINTSDIVDMTVLKDASSAAIYGSRGANGVIIITTRKGSTAELKISYNNNIGIRQAANLVEMADSEEYQNYVQAATGTAPTLTEYDTDWYDEIMRTAVNQNHNITLSGKTESLNYLLNVGYFKDQGIVLKNDFTRFSIRANTEYYLTKKLSSGILSSFANNENQNGFGTINIDTYGNIGGVYNNAYRAAPIIASKVGSQYGNTSAYQNVGNPLLDVNNNDINVKENRLQATTFLQYEPASWVRLRTSIGGDLRSKYHRGYFYQFLADENTFLISGGNQQNPLSRLEVLNTQSFRWVWDNMATFFKKFDEHDFTLLVGTTAEKYNYRDARASRKDVPADKNLWYIGVGDANTSQNDGTGDAWSRNSYLARLNYSWKEKFLLTATMRVDGSSRLPEKNRWQQYPSVGVGWVLSRENFMSDQNLFDQLKLRASYGKVGNDQIPTNAFTQTVLLNRAYAYTGSATSATNGAQINQIIDPNINWETTEEYDLALEFGALDARLTGEVNYYNKKVENALSNIPIPRTVGDADGVIITNVASIQNTGIELVLNWRNQVNDNFTYNVGGNATWNTNEVLNLNGGQRIFGGGIGAAQGYTTVTDNGYPIGSFYVLKTLGVFNTGDEVNQYVNADGKRIQPTAKPGDFKYQDTNNDGVISDDDRIVAGSYQPVAYFGINAGANYKQWDFSIAIYGNIGNEVYNGKKAVRVQGLDNVEKEVVYSRWTSAGKSQSEPGANVGNLPASTYYVESGDFIRINNLTIGYTVKPDFLSRYKLSALRIFATSQNLFTWKKYSGFTPELPGDPISSGIELSAYPTTRTIAAGLNLTF